MPLWIGMSLYKGRVKTWNRKLQIKKHLCFGFTKIWNYNCSILLVYSLLLFHCAKFVLWQKRLLIRSKKYIDQEPPYLMRQIRVLQWEEIKTENSGQRIIFEGKGPKVWNKNILLLYFPYWPESQKSKVFALTWYINLFFVGL